MSSWDANPWSNFCDPHWELTCRNKWHSGTSEIYTSPEIAVGMDFHALWKYTLWLFNRIPYIISNLEDFGTPENPGMKNNVTGFLIVYAGNMKVFHSSLAVSFYLSLGHLWFPYDWSKPVQHFIQHFLCMFDEILDEKLYFIWRIF